MKGNLDVGKSFVAVSSWQNILLILQTFLERKDGWDLGVLIHTTPTRRHKSALWSFDPGSGCTTPSVQDGQRTTPRGHETPVSDSRGTKRWQGE